MGLVRMRGEVHRLTGEQTMVSFAPFSKQISLDERQKNKLARGTYSVGIVLWSVYIHVPHASSLPGVAPTTTHLPCLPAGVLSAAPQLMYMCTPSLVWTFSSSRIIKITIPFLYIALDRLQGILVYTSDSARPLEIIVLLYMRTYKSERRN